MPKKIISGDSPAIGGAGPQSACHEQRFASPPPPPPSGGKSGKDGSPDA